MSKREREERSKDKKKKKKLKKSPEYVVLRALKKNDLSRARGILCVFTQAIFEMIDDCPPNFEDWSNLMFGAFLGYVNVVKVLIQKGADVNAVVDDVERGEMTALHIAAARGHVEVAKVLIQNGADVNAVMIGNWTALHMAADKGHVEVAKVLIQNGPDVNAKKDKNTALHFAADHGHINVVKLLIQNGADVNAADKLKKTALHVAISRCNLDVVKVLGQNGVDVNAVDYKKETALDISSRFDIPLTLQLICLGAEINENALQKDRTGQLRTIHNSLESLRAGNGIRESLMSDEERRFMWNLAFSFTIAHRGAAFKAYYSIRSFITFHGIFMGFGYGVGDRSAWQKYSDDSYT